MPTPLRPCCALFALAALPLLSCSKDDASKPSTPGAHTAGREETNASEPRVEAPASLSAATPERPLTPEEPRGLVPTRNGPGTGGNAEPRLGALRVPEGFDIEVYSTRVPHARSLALGSPGTLFVSTRRSDEVYAVVDKDGDHGVDAVHTVAEGLDTPNGIAFRDGTLYIAEIERLLKIDDVEAKLGKPLQPTVVRSDFPDDEHHGWRYLRFGPDGWLYMAVGAPCNLCERENPLYASIARMRPEGGPIEVYAKGVRNSVGYDFHPQTKQLWFTENGRDELGDDLPPDELNRAAEKGQHFGFPYCHAGVIRDPELGEGHPCDRYTPPVQALAPHAAALGMRFYTGTMFPPEYRGAVILAEHGSWNRAERIGYRVMVVRLEGDRAVSYEPLVTGFLDDETGEVYGRPVDVEVLDDGSLIVSDDFTGTLYRVTYGA